MFGRAIAWGHRPTAAGNPRAGDLAKPSAAPREREAEAPACVAARPPLLTGCGPGETRRPRWREVKPDRLARVGAKAGPRRVLLGAAARELRARP